MTVETWTPSETRSGSAALPYPRRALWPAVKRGFLGRCPNCGEGRLFARYLKPVDHCAACGEAFHHHRADDLPPYLTIVVVGHIIVPMVLWVEQGWHPEVWIQLSLWLPLTLAATLALLQPIKGAVVGLQWANRMHGFGGEEDDPHPAAPEPTASRGH